MKRGTDAAAEIREAAAFPIPRGLASQGSRKAQQLGTNQILRELDPAALNTVLGLCKSKSLFIFHYRICFAEQSPSDPLLAPSRGSRYRVLGSPGRKIQQDLSPSPLRRSLLSTSADARRPLQPPSPSASELRPSSPALRDSSCEHCGSSPYKTPCSGRKGSGESVTLHCPPRDPSLSS